ncbi:MAG: ATP-dependent helicase, partial [Deltaproteobacteria bacterium]|nr:ATP-dependent helicase [Deltaproteobacteria bacterium]
ELGIEEDTADAIESQYYLRARLSPAPPIPHVEPPAALTINEQTVPLVTEIPYEKLWATLTDEQLRLVKRPERGLMIVKGAAGSGKTIVGVRRIEHILAGQLFGRRVLYLCYNKVLQGIVDQQLTEILGDLRRASRVEVTTAYRWMLGIAERMMHSRLLGPESRSEEGKAVEKGVAEEETACASEARNSEVLTYSGIVRANRADGGKLKELILQTLSGLDRPRRNDLPGKFLLEEFRDVIYGRGILSESDYLDPGGTPRRDIRAPLGWSVPFRPEDRGYVWGVFEKFDALCRERNVIMWESIPWRLLKILPERPRDKREYDYIVIDEAQDLTPAMFKVVLRLQGESHDGIMVLGDAAQRLYRPAFRWVDTGLPPTGGHVSVLRRCQRSTRQIVAVAQSVAEGMEKGLGEDLVYPDAADRDGPLPLLISAEDQGMELQYLCEEIYRLLMDEYVPAASIAVLAGTRTLLEKVRSNLGEYGVPTEIYHGALETRQ